MGEGKLDIFAAVSRSTRDQKATLSGTITDQATGTGLLGMTVTAVGPAPKQNNVIATSNANGHVYVALASGNLENHRERLRLHQPDDHQCCRDEWKHDDSQCGACFAAALHAQWHGAEYVWHPAAQRQR